VKDIDAFLGPLLDTPLAATAIQPENTTPAQPSAFSRDDDAPAPKTGTTPAQPPAFSQDAAAARQPSVPAAGSPLMTKSFHLQNGVAADYSTLLQDIFARTKLTADPRTNAIIAAGEEQDLQKIEALLLKLDEAKSKSAPSEPLVASGPASTQKIEVHVFTAKWSKPCQDLLKTVRELMAEGHPVHLVDVDRDPDTTQRFQIDRVPTIIVVADGQEAQRRSGALSPAQIRELVTRSEWPLSKPLADPNATTISPRRTLPKSVPEDSLLPSSPVHPQERSEVAALESRAAELARKVRELSKSHGSAHPDLIAARQQLEQSLTEALELKFRSEQRQVATLEQRLTRLKSQLDQRKAVRHEIVERRLRELLETPATRWNSDEPSSDSSISIAPQGAEVAATTQQSASRDQIVVDLYATDPIYQNQQLIGAVVAPLNKLTNVIANIRIVPGDSGKFVSATVRNTSRRFLSEESENGGTSPTRRAIEAALKAGGIEDVRWEGVTEEVAVGDFLPSNPSNGEAAPVAATAPAPIPPPARKPADSLEASARLTLDLAEAEADIRESEDKLAIQVKLHAKGVVAIDEVTSAMQRRDRAVRKRQILLDEFAASVKDLELQLSAASLENDLAVLDHRRLIQLVEQNAVPLKEAQDAGLRAVRSAHTLERLKNRLEFLKKSGEGSAVKEPSPSNPPGETPASPTKPTPDPQPVKN
jgi:thioredoxin 1